MLKQVSLEDKYLIDEGVVFMTTMQALARLPMLQRDYDLAQGLNTAGFISGYRGSPIGGLDQNLWKAKKFLKSHHIHFEPGINEDLGATAVWGSQQVNLYQGVQYDGVFGMWYGKGPGVDRTGDVFKHANAAGTSKHGGVLVIAGDDHACKSSTLPHQSEYAFMDAMIPVLNPSNTQDIIDFGLLGIAMSRYSGCWVALKTIGEIADSSSRIYLSPQRYNPIIPKDFMLPEGGVHIRGTDIPLQQEERQHLYKLPAVQAFARANGIDKTIYKSDKPRLGIITTGKGYLDVRQALDMLGITEDKAKALGISLFKVGLTWPLEPQVISDFCRGMDKILVVEEKRGVIEDQLRTLLYGKSGYPTTIIGKLNEQGQSLIPSISEINPKIVSRAIAHFIQPIHSDDHIKNTLCFFDQKQSMLLDHKDAPKRVPYFCSGCPHNTSTKVPDGSRAMAGIGCHYMVMWMDRGADTYTQMGGEGTPWIGQAPFTDEKHVFSNLGDGTYFHSGLLAIRAAVAAGVNITYKILYNDAVAMTGGQPLDGELSVPRLARQVAAEDVKAIRVVSDEPDKYPRDADWPKGITFSHRRELESVQNELKKTSGTTIIIYDQTCAAEKRRRRKRGLMVDPPKRVFINEAVCEGCGDCGVVSNCMSILPAETEMGRKRKIDQSSCNKDFSCVEGFCPSFVTVHGGDVRKQIPGDNGTPQGLPQPTIPPVDTPYNILINGVGGTGVITIGALLSMAAHLEDKGCTVLDMTGLAQKGGAVVSHLRIAKTQDDLHAVRIASGEADLVMGADLMVSGSPDILETVKKDRTQILVNSNKIMGGPFTQDADMVFPEDEIKDFIFEIAGEKNVTFFNATELAGKILGDSIAANIFMIGYAFQKGWLPFSEEALLGAIKLNGVAIDFNNKAFQWGRQAAHDWSKVEDILNGDAHKPKTLADMTVKEIIEHRTKLLTKYQNAAYAQRYQDLMTRIQQAEQKLGGSTGLTRAAAIYYAKLLAYKDEYEVARLYTDGNFMDKLQQQFDGNYKLKFHLAPPIMSKRDKTTGKMIKREFGPWMMRSFRLLAKLKSLRGTKLDIFGYTQERRDERRLITEYEELMSEITAKLNADNYLTAIDLASLPEHIRGYGHVKEASLENVNAQKAELLKKL